MTHVVRIAVLLAAVGACTPDPAANASIDIAGAASQAQGTINAYGESVAAEHPRRVQPKPMTAPEPLRPPAPGTAGGLPDDRTPVSEARFAPDSAQGAADVVQTYYALLGERAYARARALWEPGADGAGGSAAAFAAGFARYTEYRGQVGAPGEIDAGAGQRYVTVPVQVSARLGSGGVMNARGEAMLQRTGDIDGATVEQRRWRLRTITLRPAVASAAEIRYRCMDGSRITVSVDPAGKRATVRSAGQADAVLHGARTGSHSSYRGGGFTLVGDAERATFTRPHQPPLACIGH